LLSWQSHILSLTHTSFCLLLATTIVAYYVDQIPSLTNLCWHRLETSSGDKRIVHVPARICAVKKASQQAMIDDLGFLKGGRFRVVPTSELIRFSGSSTKKKWCSKFMKEYLEYISHHHNANDVKEEERFLKKVLRAVKEKDHDDEEEGRDDEESDKSEDSVYIHSKKNGTSIDVHATNQATSIYMDVRDEPPTVQNDRGDSFGAFPTKRKDGTLDFDSRRDTARYHSPKHGSAKKKSDARVTFDMGGEHQPPVLEKSPVKQVTDQFSQIQLSTSAESSSLDVDTWWIVLKGDTKVTRGATSLVNRCMRTFGWSESYATRVLLGYKQFCSWKQAFEDWDDTALAPPPPIGQMWQQHLLDSRNYQKDCILLFGNVLQYNPNNGADTMLERERIENTKRIAHVRFRGKDYDKDVWAWSDDTADFAVKDLNAFSQEPKREVKPTPALNISHSSSTDDVVPQSMREALALVQQARMDLKSHQTRPYTLQISSTSSDVSSVSANQTIRLRIIGNGKNGLRSASITMDFSANFEKVFEEYAGEYARRIGQTRVFLRFLTKDGRRIGNCDSPKTLSMMNNDEIHVVQPESDRSSWI